MASHVVNPAGEPSLIQSLLFVPGNRPERFDRALATEADLVCIDLEDSVPPDQKTAAREAFAAYAAVHPGDRLGVRINAVDGAWVGADLLAARAAAFVMLPKAESGDALAAAHGVLAASTLWPLVETAAGLRNVWQIAAAPGVAGVLFGAFDFAADVGCEMEWEPLLFARSQVAVACAAARIQAMDAPSGDLQDLMGLITSTRRAKTLGFTARACIHPDQISGVHEGLAPTPDEVQRAMKIVAAFEAANGAAAQLDGRLIERPVAAAAERLLARVRRLLDGSDKGP